MASQDPNPNRTPMYPQIDPYPPTAPRLNTSSSSPSLYPTVEMNDLLINLFPDSNQGISPRSQGCTPSAPPDSSEESLLTIPGAILHLIDKQYSVELATGDLRILCLYQGDNTIAALAAVSDDIQWPLTKDLTSVKLDSSHYFFSFRAPREAGDSDSSDEDDKTKKKTKKKKKKEGEENEVLSYGLTIVSKGQEGMLKELDEILDNFSNFSVHKVEEKAAMAVVGANAGDITAGELKRDEKKMEEVEGQCAAYWTTLAPNVEEYSGTAARLIAKGSGQLVKGILWCGDVTVDRLKWGDEVLRQRMAPGDQKQEIDPNTLKRIKRFVLRFT